MVGSAQFTVSDSDKVRCESDSPGFCFLCVPYAGHTEHSHLLTPMEGNSNLLT